MDFEETKWLATDLSRPTRLRITVEAGPDAGAQMEFSHRVVTVGRAPSCDLSLRDKTVSLQHATLWGTTSGIRVADKHSCNGLLLGEARLLAGIIPSGSSLQLGLSRLRVECGPELPTCRTPITGIGPLIGQSMAMQYLYDDIERVAAVDTPLLILGPAGSGKSLVAASVYRYSRRARRELHWLDASIVAEPDPMRVQAALFGHVANAFPGATYEESGLLARLCGGVLYINEITDCSLPLQHYLAEILRAEQARPVGGVDSYRVDVRIIAASRCDVTTKVNDGSFNRHLYDLLTRERMILRVPSLIERVDDIPLLVEHFLRQMPKGQAARLISPEALGELRSRRYDLGNVAELQDSIELVAFLAQNSTCITLEHIAIEKYLTDQRQRARTVDRARLRRQSVATKGCKSLIVDVKKGSGIEPDLLTPAPSEVSRIGVLIKEDRDKLSDGDPSTIASATWRKAKSNLASERAREWWKHLYHVCGGNISEMSRRAKVARQTVRQNLFRYGLHRQESSSNTS